MKDTYIFPAVFHVDEDGVSVYFPDLPGCLTCADTMEQAFVRAKEALQLHLYGIEEDAEEVPSPTSLMERQHMGKASGSSRRGCHRSVRR